MNAHDFIIYGHDEPYEIHHKDCSERDPHGDDATGDSTAAGVETAANADEEFDLACSCLDPLLGSDRDRGDEQ